MSIRIGIGLDVFGAGIDANATAIYNRIIADGGVSNLTRLNFFVKGLKAIYGDLANVPVCYDAHWIGYKLGSGTGATSGQAAAKLYSLTVAGDAVQATAASQPLLLAHNGASSDNYLYAGPGSDVAGAYCQTSTNVSPQVNTNFAFEFNFKDFNSRGILGGCPTGSSDGWSLQIQGGTNLLRLYVRNSLVNTAIDSTTAITVTGNRWVKVVRSGNDYSFFEKADGGTYTQVGTTITNIILLNSYNLPIQIGDGFRANYISIGCKILRARFYNDATATNLVVDFNPATYNASTSQTQWTSSTGEVWTINTGTATSGYKGVLVDRTIVQSDGVDDNLVNLTINQLSPFSYNLSFKQYQLTAGAVSGILGRGTSKVAIGAGNYNTKTNTIWTWAPTQLSTYGGANDMDKNLNLFQSIIPSMTESGWSMRKNNSNYGSVGETSGTPVDGGGVYLFYSGNGSEYSNSIINTVVISNNAQATAQSTEVYNFIKTLNNNAF